MAATAVMATIDSANEERCHTACSTGSLTGSPDTRTEAEVVRWARRGLHGLVTRENSVGQLVATIRAVRGGKCLCSPRVATALLRALAKQADHRDDGEPSATLTRREHEVAHFLAHGMSNRGIARSLGIAVSTAKNHVHNVLTRLGLQRRAQVGSWIRWHDLPQRPGTGRRGREEATVPR